MRSTVLAISIAVCFFHQESMPRVCHISPVHDVADNRIFYRQCHSLRDAGYEVFWVVTNDRDEVIDGINVVALKKRSSLVGRWIFAGWEAMRKALETQSDIYHFHDPEFLPLALLMRCLGKQVVYDIHEDYVSAVSQKFYIPRSLRGMISWLFGFVEVSMARCFQQVIAERYYAERFPNATQVLNYPRIHEQLPCRRSETALLYTGKVHIYRGAKTHAKLPQLVEGCTVSFVGFCASDLHAELVEEYKGHLDQLSFVGVGENVPFQDILRQYREGSWLAGLAIFPPNEHLDRKELTKFFEYMTYGLPIIASNFPVWRELIEENGCGICVDPEDDLAIEQAVRRLQDPKLWQQMSANGQRTVQSKYSWDSQEKKLLALYETMLGNTSLERKSPAKSSRVT